MTPVLLARNLLRTSVRASAAYSSRTPAHATPVLLHPVRLLRARGRHLANRPDNRRGDAQHVGYAAVAVTHRRNRHRDRDFRTVAAHLQGRKPRHNFSRERLLLEQPGFHPPLRRQQNLICASYYLTVN